MHLKFLDLARLGRSTERHKNQIAELWANLDFFKQNIHIRRYIGPIKSQDVGTVRKPSDGGGFFQHTYEIHTKQLKDCTSKSCGQISSFESISDLLSPKQRLDQIRSYHSYILA